MIPYRTPFFLPWLYPKLTWLGPPRPEKTLYLTFDDGPIPDITEQVLAILQEKNVPATFFCIGENVQKHPAVMQQVVAAGHSVGNHTFNHLNGWKTPTPMYLENTEKCRNSMDIHTGSRLFRPPYGRIKKSQQSALLPDYEVIMWSLLTQDYRRDIAKEECLKKTRGHLHDRAIIVFHDSLKAAPTMLYCLPRLIDAALEDGYRFEKL